MEQVSNVLGHILGWVEEEEGHMKRNVTNI